MQPSILPRTADYYRQRADEMRKRATRVSQHDLIRLYDLAAKTWEELATKAEEKIGRKKANRVPSRG